MKVKVQTLEGGKASGDIELNDAVFGVDQNGVLVVGALAPHIRETAVFVRHGVGRVVVLRRTAVAGGRPERAQAAASGGGPRRR